MLRQAIAAAQNGAGETLDQLWGQLAAPDDADPPPADEGPADTDPNADMRAAGLVRVRKVGPRE
jgi:hypothetical protein